MTSRLVEALGKLYTASATGPKHRFLESQTRENWIEVGGKSVSLRFQHSLKSAGFIFRGHEIVRLLRIVRFCFSDFQLNWLLQLVYGVFVNCLSLSETVLWRLLRKVWP